MTRILAFDIGIKNLAWCCAESSALRSAESNSALRSADKNTDINGKLTILGWANENILTGGTAEEDRAAAKCPGCTNKVAYVSAKGGSFCSRHCPPLTPALRGLDGKLLKKLPKATQLKEIAKKHGAEKQHLKTGEIAKAFLAERFCFPIEAPQKVKKVEMEVLHDGIQNVVISNANLFSTCSEILLENQPVFKNPIMKSIQMMLFATLRDLLENQEGNPPRVRLVHAGRKTAGATKGDEGYAERKGASEAKVIEGLKKGKIQMACGKSASWFSEQAKKSDLADCLVMCADALDIKLPLPPALIQDAKELE